MIDIDALTADQAAARAEIHRGIGCASFIKGTNPGALIYGPARCRSLPRTEPLYGWNPRAALPSSLA